MEKFAIDELIQSFMEYVRCVCVWLWIVFKIKEILETAS